ncbi:MAG: FtsX-like permease family protein [Acidobacteriota bacterium]
MIFKLVLENVRYRPVRTFLSILLIAVPVTLILTIIGLSIGFFEDSRKRSGGVGADILIKPPNANLISFSSVTMPEKLIDVLAKQPHVAQAMGTVVNPTSGFLEALNGIDPAAFDKMSGGFVYEEGHNLEGPDDILIDSWYASQHKLHAGGTINISNKDWHIAGIVEPGKLGHMFVQMKTLQEMIGASKRVSQVFVKLDDPGNTEQVIAQLKTKFDGYPILSMEELQSLLSVDHIPVLKTFINVIIGLSVLIGFAVVSLSMYMAVLQRTREIGILKSLGATKRLVMGIILAEAFCLGLGGTILGILLSYVSRLAIQAMMPQAIVYTWWPIAGGIAMGASLLGALYPGMMAVRQDPIEALAYE